MKFSALRFPWLVAWAGLLAGPVSAGSVASPYEVATWRGFRAAAVSYTFDDSCPNQFAIAVPMFNQKGLRMTLFTITSIQGSGGWQKLQAAAGAGHEIASHTVTHANLGSLTLAQQATEQADSQSAINAAITNQSCMTIAYPYCASGSESLTAQYYMAARNCSGVINSSNPPNFMQISCFICGSLGSVLTLSDFTNTARSTAAAGGWGVYLIHGIDNDGGYSPLASSVLQSSVDYYAANTNRYWVDTFANVARYIRERNDVSVAEVAADSSSVTVRVTDTLTNTIYDVPVTVRRPLPAGWPWALAVQNGAAIPCGVVTNNSQAFAVFDALPDGGDVTLMRALVPGTLFRVAVPPQATEGDGVLAGAGQVIVQTAPTNDLLVTLSSSDTSEILVPPTVLLPAGSTNAAFDITVVDDALLDRDQAVSIGAFAADYGIYSTSMVVHDNDATALTVSLPATVTEGVGLLAGAGRVSVPAAVAASYTIQLTSSSPTRLYVPPTVTLNAGNTSAVFNLTVTDNSVIEGPQPVTVTAHYTNWTDGAAQLSILDDEALPDHFSWGPVASPQIIGELFAVSLTAQDASNATLNFTMPVQLGAFAPAPAVFPTNTLLGAPALNWAETDPSGYVFGYSFTPSAGILVTHVRTFFGSKVSIWTDRGTLLAAQPVAGVPGTWTETALAAPVLLVPGATYRVGVYEPGGFYYWGDSLPASAPGVVLQSSYWNDGDAFPNQPDAAQWYYVDLRYSTDVVSVAVSPSQTGNFAAGTWSGSVAVGGAGNPVVLSARAGSGPANPGNAFTVLGTPKLAITASGDSVVVSWPAVAAGFQLEQAPPPGPAAGWSVVPSVAALLGDRLYVTNARLADAVLYRLRK
ncbi:MAG: polysaccharide deacetylase family protein [Verrucomicrobiota bacterium]